MQLLLANNAKTDLPDFESYIPQRRWRHRGDGVIDSDEAALRTLANDLFRWINEQGGN